MQFSAKQRYRTNDRARFTRKRAARDLMNKNDMGCRVSLQLEPRRFGARRADGSFFKRKRCVEQAGFFFSFRNEKFYRVFHVNSLHVSILGNHEKWPRFLTTTFTLVRSSVPRMPPGKGLHRDLIIQRCTGVKLEAAYRSNF